MKRLYAVVLGVIAALAAYGFWLRRKNEIQIVTTSQPGTSSSMSSGTVANSTGDGAGTLGPPPIPSPSVPAPVVPAVVENVVVPIASKIPVVGSTAQFFADAAQALVNAINGKPLGPVTYLVISYWSPSFNGKTDDAGRPLSDFISPGAPRYAVDVNGFKHRLDAMDINGFSWREIITIDKDLFDEFPEGPPVLASSTGTAQSHGFQPAGRYSTPEETRAAFRNTAAFRTSLTGAAAQQQVGSVLQPVNAYDVVYGPWQLGMVWDPDRSIWVEGDDAVYIAELEAKIAAYNAASTVQNTPVVPGGMTPLEIRTKRF